MRSKIEWTFVGNHDKDWRSREYMRQCAVIALVGGRVFRGFGTSVRRAKAAVRSAVRDTNWPA